MNKTTEILAEELKVRPEHAEAVIRLLDEGNTVPFIARYRKEQHGSMDDQAIRMLADRLQYLRGLDARKEEVKAAIGEQGKLTPELEEAISGAGTLAEVDDLYRPYRPKRKTRASVAREKGLEPLAQLIFTGKKETGGWLKPEELEALIENYVNLEKGVMDAGEALQGAKDIIAEQFSDDADIRKRLRENLQRNGTLRSAAATEEDTVYRLYYEFEEPLRRLQSHQILAIDRGEREGALKVSVLPGEWGPVQLVLEHGVSRKNPFQELLREVAEDSWSRLIFPSLERELRNGLTERADEQAIHTFAVNLRPLLMQPPVKGKVTLGFDPAYRTGCKLAVVDATGKCWKRQSYIPPSPTARWRKPKRCSGGCATSTTSAASPLETAPPAGNRNCSSASFCRNTAGTFPTW